MSKVLYEAIDGVALITINNPPVNSMGHEVRLGMLNAIERANDDPRIGAIVLNGQGQLFTGGADIREFGTTRMLADPSLPVLISLVEDNDKPVIAAIRGTCIGGGLELALGCHYRIATEGAKLGLPEVKLGLLPGAGGTQRLPRAVGLELATNMIVSGESLPAAVLHQAGAFAKLVPDEQLIEAALAFGREIAAVRPLPSLTNVSVNHPDAHGFLGAMRTAVRSSAAGFPAPLKCLDALQSSVERPIGEGLAHEARLFAELLLSPESLALRHLFFAEREVARISNLPRGTEIRTIQRVGIVGAGTMGGGIAMNFLNAGIPVVLLETNAEALERGIALIRRNYEASVKKRKLSESEAGKRMTLLEGSLDYADFSGCDLLIEAVYEDMGVKEQVFRKLDEVAKPGAILATNTSTLDVDRIAAFTQRPGDVVGLHFFSPANVMKLLEVVRGAHTRPDVLATAMGVAKKIRKVAVVAGVCDGFIGNRMIDPYGAVAYALVEAGATPQQVDSALEKFGFAMGPFRMNDMAGNDISWAIRKRKRAEDPEAAPPGIADRLCELGRFGQKAGKGWYAYPNGRQAVVDPEVEALVADYRLAKGISARSFTDEEIVSRCVLALVNEGAKVLQDGIAARASDIDIVYIYGYGFPAQRGGPMYYANTLGVNRIRRMLRKFGEEALAEARIWEPAGLLLALAKEGKHLGEQIEGVAA